MTGSIADPVATVGVMARQVALFRGINVGGNNRVPMAELRAEFEALGFTNVASIIQSGNVVFDGADEEATGDRIREAIRVRFDVDVPVLRRTATDFAATLAAHPFEPGAVEPKMHHVMFLAGPAPADAAAQLGDHTPGAEYVIDDDAIHVRYPDGSARSKFTVDLVDRRLGGTASARNLPTCDKIAALLTEG